ncbi:MAG: hypothetical protein PHZ19_08290 [Candidatus Thermoplasmatota archaeon]|nr:hypothetical protein [Candidatus Thermoplasmatota archaeon]
MAQGMSYRVCRGSWWEVSSAARAAVALREGLAVEVRGGGVLGWVWPLRGGGAEVIVGDLLGRGTLVSRGAVPTLEAVETTMGRVAVLARARLAAV